MKKTKTKKSEKEKKEKEASKGYFPKRLNKMFFVRNVTRNRAAIEVKKRENGGRKTGKTPKPWTQKVALRPLGVILVFQLLSDYISHFGAAWNNYEFFLSRTVTYTCTLLSRRCVGTGGRCSASGQKHQGLPHHCQRFVLQVIAPALPACLSRLP